MRSPNFLIAILILAMLALSAQAKKKSSSSWSGTATVTHYNLGGGQGACNCKDSKMQHKYPTAALNQLYFGATSGKGSGSGCGRCFRLKITGSVSDPSYKPKNGAEIVVKVTDECPAIAPNLEWCAQTKKNPVNKHGATHHFDLDLDSGVPSSFFPVNSQGAALGTLFVNWKEVQCTEWSGYHDTSVEGTTSSSWGCCPVNPLKTGFCANHL